MSQHDYDIANQTTPLFRADLNNALQALSSQSAGATAPSPTYANMTWYDTANNLLKMRSEADDAWITIGTLDQSANTFTAALAGTPTAATATLGTNTTQLATTAFVQSALAEAPSSFNTSSYALYETSGTFLIPANYAAVVHALGAGGSGAAAGSSRTCVASGGGAGGSAVKYVTATGSDRTVSFTIGAGGAAASDFGAGAVAGNAGGTTTVTGTGISLSATGGGGGSGAISTSTGELIASGAAGGTATGGDENITGGATGTITKPSGNGYNVGAGAMVGGGDIAASSAVLTTTGSGTVADSTVSYRPLDYATQGPAVGGFGWSSSDSNLTAASSGAGLLGAGSGGAVCGSSGGGGSRNAVSGPAADGAVFVVLLRSAG